MFAGRDTGSTACIQGSQGHFVECVLYFIQEFFFSSELGLIDLMASALLAGSCQSCDDI